MVANRTLLIIGLISFFALSCKSQASSPKNVLHPKVNFSLAQWSFHKALRSGEMNNFDFIDRATYLDFQAVEFVNQFFLDRLSDTAFLDSLKTYSDQKGIINHLLMVDEAGDLGDSDSLARANALAKHQQWVKAAQRIGCKYMRINARGDGDADEVLMLCAESIRKLADYANSFNIQILIENHGSYSNDANWLSDLYHYIDHNNVGLLPDFDNWCIERENGKLWGAPCKNEFERYEGMALLMPFAKALSVKSFKFNQDGEETSMDYNRLISIVKSSGYSGYFGIEYEGDQLSPEEGINKTRGLVIKSWNNN